RHLLQVPDLLLHVAGGRVAGAPVQAGAPPSTVRTALAEADEVGADGVTVGTEVSSAVDSVNGSGPSEFADWRKTSPPAAWSLVPPPSERVNTTVRITAAATAAAIAAMPGTERHHGRRPGPGGPAEEPPPVGGGWDGGPLGGCEGPDSGPDGGPVGRPEDGGSTLTSSSSRAGGPRQSHIAPDTGGDAYASCPTCSFCAPVVRRPQADADGPPGGRRPSGLLSVTE